MVTAVHGSRSINGPGQQSNRIRCRSCDGHLPAWKISADISALACSSLLDVAVIVRPIPISGQDDENSPSLHSLQNAFVEAVHVYWNGNERQEAQLCVVENLAFTQDRSRSFEITPLRRPCASSYWYNCVSLSYHFWDIQRRIMACHWNLG